MATEAPKELPHNYEAILKKADIHSVGDLHDHCRAGVFLDNKTTRFWTESSTNFNSFMLYARALSITWGDDPRYWRWLWIEGDMDIEVAELLDVCWLEVNGGFDMMHFTPGIKYEVMFVIMMKDPSGFIPEATLKLELPDGEISERKLSLEAVAPKKWAEVKAGEFVATGKEGEIKFSLLNYDELNWKKGLIIEGVLIQPCP